MSNTHINQNSEMKKVDTKVSNTTPVESIVKFLNTKTNLKDKRIYMSLFYIQKNILKDTIMRDFRIFENQLTDNEWLEILNQKAIFPLKNSANIKLYVEHKLDVLKKIHGEKISRLTKRKWTEIGLYQALDDKDTDKLIKLMDSLAVTIDDIFEIYSQINAPDKNKNDFFTPMDISNSVANIATAITIKNKKNISIFDGACGIGNLLYSTYKQIKRKNQNITIEVFGNDLDTTYATFAESMFNLFNQNNSYLENKNFITEYQKIFPGKKMDIVIANPPFGQALTNKQYTDILQKNQDSLTKAQTQQLKKAMAS